MLGKVWTKAKELVTQHGPEIGAVAKIAANALIPGAPLIVSSVEALCDYSADKSAEVSQAQVMAMLEGLGGDVAYLERLLTHLTGELSDTLGAMIQSAHFGSPPQALEAMMNQQLEARFSDLRDELRALAPELETIKAQGEAMLNEQYLQGDMLREALELLKASQAFSAPLASEGVSGPNVGVFLAARGRFDGALLSGDLNAAEGALSEMKRLSPHGNIAKLCELALKGVRQDFEGVEAVAHTITGDDPLILKVKQSATRYTSAVRRGPSAPAHQEQAHTPQVGQQIGDKGWRLTGLLGRGGMGSVWRVENSRGAEGALKLMSASLSGEVGFVERFKAEIDALDRVSHPAVIEILDWGCDRSGAWYFVMPFIKGASLRSRLLSGALKDQELKALTRALLGGLVACHDANVIHRDIKPDNIMLREDGSPVLIDFGIAHQAGKNSGHTSFATGGYAPPEQLAGRAVDHSADLFALGMTLAECLGERAGEGEWGKLIAQLTHFMPSARGTASSVLKRLSEPQRAYHVTLPAQPPEGPLTLSAVVERILQGQGQLHVWFAGAPSWALWREVSEVKGAVEAARLKRAPTPPLVSLIPTLPSVPTALARVERKAGELVSCHVEGVGFKMAYCPAGEFWMGSEEGVGHGDERPRHRVKISKPFLMGQTQVTQALWQAVMGENPSGFKGSDLPVEKVSWFDMVRFCNRLSELENFRPVYGIGSGDKPNVSLDFSANGYRLPTEAEWEYAAKAGTELEYAGSANIDEVAWYSSNSSKNTHKVATKKPNAWGLYDMSGNVWEWCNDQWDEDAYKSRKSRPEVNSDPCNYASAPALRVFRGGCWLSDAVNCRVSLRRWDVAAFRGRNLGGRLLRWNIDR